MTIDQMAKLAGVSTATISRVINRSPAVRPATAARVQKLIADVGYVPNATLVPLAQVAAAYSVPSFPSSQTRGLPKC
jgi:LacI family transcriptional regulator